MKLALITRKKECVFERVSENAIRGIFCCPLMPMTEQLNIVCGADIHQRFLITAILCRDSRMWANRFLMNINGLLTFKDWLISYDCQKVAVVSTGRFWIPIHMVLEGTVDVIVANAYRIKHTTKRRTDLKGSRMAR